MFAEPSDAAMVRAAARAAQLEVVLRQRERALRQLAREETAGKASSAALASYRAEIAKLEANAETLRAELVANEHVLDDLRGRLDVELNVLKRESGRLRRRAAGDGGETADAAAFKALESDLLAAASGSDVALRVLSDSLSTLEAETAAIAAPVATRFSVRFETNVNQTVHVVGSWCDWDVELGVPLRWTEDHLWVGDVELPTGASHEYKYIVTERLPEKQPGDQSPWFPQWGFAEQRLMGLSSWAPPIQEAPDRAPELEFAAHLVCWQKGNNNALNLSNVDAREVVRVELRDAWDSAESAPMARIGANGKVIHIEEFKTKTLFGAGASAPSPGRAVLEDALRKAESALVDARAQMDEITRLAAETLFSATDGGAGMSERATEAPANALWSTFWPGGGDGGKKKKKQTKKSEEREEKEEDDGIDVV
jgi:hypothetical protein